MGYSVPFSRPVSMEPRHNFLDRLSIAAIMGKCWNSDIQKFRPSKVPHCRCGPRADQSMAKHHPDLIMCRKQVTAACVIIAGEIKSLNVLRCI